MQEPRPKRIAKCSLVVEGTAFIDGPCDFLMQSSDGSFQISSPDNSYFAQVDVERPGRAIGWWSEDKGAGHAHSALGTLIRDKAC